MSSIIHSRNIQTALVFCAILLCITAAPLVSQTAYEGYTLFNPTNSRSTYLIDMKGTTVKTWTNAQSGGYSVYLLPNGNIIRPATYGSAVLRGAAYSGLIHQTDWSGKVVWSYIYSGPTYIAHHDICPMPNGNVVLIAWESKTAAEATALGRSNAATMWPDHLVEVKPTGATTGEIVWEWHAWDHLVQDKDPAKPNYGVISENPGRLNINLGSVGGGPGGGDWLHINGVSYNAEDDLIVISSHFMNEFYVIDHSTTTEEARGRTGGRHGKGGDILYRWGKPSNYGATGATVFDVVHCSWWIPKGLPGEGHILAFNNGASKRASTIVEIVPPRDAEGRFLKTTGTAFGPASPVWSYSNGTLFYSTHLGGNQRLPNGNTHITEATAGHLLEVSSDGTIVWDYQYSREIARSLRYGKDYPGLAALVTGTDDVPAAARTLHLDAAAPNPFHGTTGLRFDLPADATGRLVIYDALGRMVRTLAESSRGPGSFTAAWDGLDASGRPASAGTYFCRLESTAGVRLQTLVLSR
ncbi:MAG: aryl-sulfate sulfotransferase [Ignavibacteriae bacterium]|nr:aryl-sulfate sulfotransferase [Ignavibacteriota bacterium]